METALTLKNANLPDLDALAASLSRPEIAETQISKCIIKMDKTGTWVYGAGATQADEDSLWAVNPYSFIHGFIAWGINGSVVREVMASMSDDLPVVGEPPEGTNLDKGWQKQYGFTLKCISGLDFPTQGVYSVTSKGGQAVVVNLALSFSDHIRSGGKDTPVPVVKLRSKKSKHPTHGTVFYPEIEIVRWVSFEDTEKPTSLLADLEDTETPARRQRRTA